MRPIDPAFANHRRDLTTLAIERAGRLPRLVLQPVDDLLGDADIAMYRAKAQGKGRYHVFRESDPDARAVRDQTWVERGPTVRRREPLRVAEPRRREPRLELAAG